MIKVKYRDAKYLCQYDLESSFFESLEVTIKDLWPTRNIFVLDCKEGKKILKMINYDNDKLDNISNLLEYLKKGYDKVLNIHKFSNGEYFKEWKGKKYVLLDLIEGIECNLTNHFDLEDVSKAIAKLHNAGVGILDSNLKVDNSSLGKLLDKFKNQRNEILEFKKMANIKKFKNEFDKTFLENCDYFLKDMNGAIKLLENSKYKELCLDKNKICVCHNDLAYHNIIIKDREVYFIDFDYASVDLRVNDIYNFTFKTLKKYGFDYDIYKEIIDNYESVNKLSDDEKELLYILFKYPSDFYSISRNYYHWIKNWTFDSYYNKLCDKVAYRKEREIFLNKIQL